MSVDETFKRLQSTKGVIGAAIYNNDGIVIKTTLEMSAAQHYGSQICALSSLARSTVRDKDQTNDLTFMRIRSKKHEIMVAPDKDYILLVLQKPPTQS